MKKIIVPTDFSKESANATAYAMRLAESLQMHVELVHLLNANTYVSYVRAYVPVYTPEMEYPRVQEDIHIAESRMNQFITSINESTPSHHAVDDYTIEYGFVNDFLKNRSHNQDVAYIVMGQRQNKDWLEKLFSSSHDTLWEEVEVPIWVIPDSAHYSPIKNTLYLTDYEDQDFEVLSKLVRLVAPFQSQIQVLHVSESSDDEALEQRKQFTHGLMERPDLKPIVEDLHVIVSEHVAQSVTDYVRIHNADLVVCYKTSKNLLQRFLDKFVYEDVIDDVSNKVAVPILIFNQKSS
ncbi:universal stress protein [Limibacter armeniacum]|uniref:universal stress protein n=1 Tax=Limibacter armeniacum TaxID=466084 RepID=UPI002FE5E8F6